MAWRGLLEVTAARSTADSFKPFMPRDATYQFTSVFLITMLKQAGSKQRLDMLPLTWQDAWSWSVHRLDCSKPSPNAVTGKSLDSPEKENHDKMSKDVRKMSKSAINTSFDIFRTFLAYLVAACVRRLCPTHAPYSLNADLCTAGLCCMHIDTSPTPRWTCLIGTAHVKAFQGGQRERRPLYSKRVALIMDLLVDTEE